MSRTQRGGTPSPMAGIGSWDLWSTPRAMQAFVVSVDVVVLLATAAMVVTTTPRWADYSTFALLLGLCLLFEEVSTRVARLRVRLAGYGHVDMTSVWTFAGAVVLPPAEAGLLCAAVFGYSWVRRDRDIGMRAYRQVFGAAVVIASCFAARGVLALFAASSSLSGPVSVTILSVAAAMLAYAVFNTGVLFAAIYLAVRPPRLRDLSDNWQDLSLEVATLCLGGLAAAALVNEPLLTILVLPPMFVLQRSVLTKQLEIAATTDAKTGLLNAATWQHLAQRELARADREHQSAAVLIIDMDNFKLVNDTYGHIAGDAVLRAAAGCLADEMRRYDAIGRFGGEEFVAILSDVDQEAAVAICERIRERVGTLAVPRQDGEPPITALSASIGVACYPEHGSTVEDLLHAADSAMYAAKHRGRNRVEVSAR